MWSLVEEGPKGQRKVWSHRLPHLPAEKLHFEEASQYLSSLANQSIFGPAALRFCFLIYLCSQGTEIQRVWSLHNVLLSLDYTAEDNKQIIDLLLQCFHRPVFIRNDDVSQMLLTHRAWFSVFHCFVCKLSAWWRVYFPRESDSWCFFSAGTLTSSGLSTVQSKTSWSFTASKTLYTL